MTTPEKITSLRDNQIFVFGSNLNGNHAGGAAKQALNEFGAIEGQGEGIMGKSYAFPTLNKNMEKLSFEDMAKSRDRLYAHASANPSTQFLVTKVGCGIAGFTEDEMKALFYNTNNPKNVVFPVGWVKVYGYKAFEKGLKCRGFQYELDKDFRHDGKIELCKSGFHFCKSLGDVYSYYSFGNDIVVAEVESEGEVLEEDDGDKSVTNHLRITRILNAEQAANNSGKLNTGHSNTGDSNTGHWNTGDRNTGDSNTGHWNTGDSNTGHSNTGHRNTGHRNTGHRNTGHRNTGHWNTGDSNTGDSNTGHRNTGHRNTGDRNTGDRNTGDSNTGHWNTGDRNTGDSNTGHWNTGDRNTGGFNTKEPKEVYVFNKKVSLDKWDKADKPNCLYFDIKEWISFSDMSDEEKKEYPAAKTTGGYYKLFDYKEAFKKSMEKASPSDIELIKKLPNFNKKIFEEISGFKIK